MIEFEVEMKNKNKNKNKNMKQFHQYIIMYWIPIDGILKLVMIINRDNVMKKRGKKGKRGKKWSKQNANMEIEKKYCRIQN